MSTIDVNNALRTFLLSDASTYLQALTAKVGVHIYTPRLPLGFRPTVPCISFKRRGGDGRGETPLLKPSFEFRCYGARTGDHEAEQDSRLVYRLLCDALYGDTSDGQTQQALLQAAGILGIEQEVEGQDLIDVDGEGEGWPYVLAYFEIEFVS